MFVSQGDAPYTYQPGSVMMIPTNISPANALKELMYERLRDWQPRMIADGSM